MSRHCKYCLGSVVSLREVGPYFHVVGEKNFEGHLPCGFRNLDKDTETYGKVDLSL